MGSVTDDLDDSIIRGETQKSDLANVVEMLLNDLWRRRKTRLRDRSTSKLTTLDTLAQIYDIKFLQLWIDGYTEYVTSIDGQGRSEIVDITKYSIDKEGERDKMLMEALGKR